jgi:signal transduction histidine kinase
MIHLAGGDSHLARLAVSARIFGLVVLAGPVLWSGGSTTGLALVAVAMIWVLATGAERLNLDSTVTIVLEGALIGTVCALSIDASLAVLGALAVPPFTAALRRGLLGAALSVSAELVTVVGLTIAAQGSLSSEQGAGTFTWIVTGAGLGLIGTFLHSTADTAAADPLAPYRDAQQLIRELTDISRGLTSGLDPFMLGADIAAAVRDELPLTAVSVLVPREEELTPLVADAEGADDGPDSARSSTGVLEDLGARALASHRTEFAERAFALPLVSDTRVVAVVAGAWSHRGGLESLHVARHLDALSGALRTTAVQLDTALLFATLRDTATARERRRLAREMHDGIAQDIASLGYLVDGLAARATTPEQAAQLRVLRERITTVVADVRQSVKSLRTEVGASASLGAAIAALARHLSDASGIPIQVTVDERTTRLRPEVESELLRIAQEAMTNAVKHARPSVIEVRCLVDAPTARIEVHDDGTGLGPPRPDSQGLGVMRERAHLVDALLTVENAPPHGTRVVVELPARTSPVAPTAGHRPTTTDPDKVTA